MKNKRKKPEKINESLPKEQREGQIGMNNQGLEMVIERYGGWDDVDIRFPIDNFLAENKQYRSFLLGGINNPNFKKFVDIKFTESLYYNYPKVAEAIANEKNGITLEDTKHMACTSGKFYVKCPNCGKISSNKKFLSYLTRKGLTCEYCDDKISIPNKMLRQIAIQLNLNWVFEYNEEFMGLHRFDAYDINLKQPIEADCFYYDNHKGNRKEVDNWKDEQAIEHNMELPRRIDLMDEETYNKNTLEYIKQQIYLAIGDLYNLDKVNWELAFINAQKSLMIEACRLWQEEHIYSTVDIGNILGLAKGTIRRYLNRGYKLGLCDYTREKAIEERGKKQSSINNSFSILYWVIKPNGEKYNNKPLCISEMCNRDGKQGLLNISNQSFNKHIKPYKIINIDKMKERKVNKLIIEKLKPFNGWQFIPLTKEEKQQYLESIK